MGRTSDSRQQQAATLPGLFRPRELHEHGVSRDRLRGMVRRGDVERVARGLYRVTDIAPTELETVAMVSKKAPGAVVCLLTALRIHGIGTQQPRQVWIAIDRRARKPNFDGLPVRVVRFSGRMLTYGVETRTVNGVDIRITSPARTVVDCFRYRHKIGVDIALEALRDVLRTREASVDEIVRVAEVCRIATVIGPYLEAVIS